MKKLFVVATVLLSCHVARANPEVLKLADKCDSLFTGVVIMRGNDRIIAIDRIIKGTVSKMDLEKAGIETKGERRFAVGDRVLFYSKENSSTFGTSPIRKGGTFSWTINDKIQSYNIDKMIQHFEK